MDNKLVCSVLTRLREQSGVTPEGAPRAVLLHIQQQDYAYLNQEIPARWVITPSGEGFLLEHCG